MNLVTFILASYGMTIILVYGKIFEPIRPKKYHFFKCPMCMGFWVGCFMWFMLDMSFNPFVAGCISSGTSYFISRLVDDDGILIKLRKEK
jgi:hypothetical protein